MDLSGAIGVVAVAASNTAVTSDDWGCLLLALAVVVAVTVLVIVLQALVIVLQAAGRIPLYRLT